MRIESKIRSTIPFESVRTAVHEVCLAVAIPSQRRSKIRYHIIPSMDLAILNHSKIRSTIPSGNRSTSSRKREDCGAEGQEVCLAVAIPSQRLSKIRHHITPCMDLAMMNHSFLVHFPISMNAHLSWYRVPPALKMTSLKATRGHVAAEQTTAIPTFTFLSVGIIVDAITNKSSEPATIHQHLNNQEPCSGKMSSISFASATRCDRIHFDTESPQLWRWRLL